MMGKKISGRLVTTIVSDLLEQTAIVAIVLWGLPKVGIRIPLWGSIVLLAVLMVGWGTWSVIIYRKGSRALQRGPVVGLPNMLGTRGEVVSPLAPEGLVRIRGELWIAKSVSGEMNPGREVIVVEQNKLRLVVRQSSVAGFEEG